MIRPTICFAVGDIYIGSTDQSLYKRFHQHKSNHKQGIQSCSSFHLFEIYGGSNLEIISLEECDENTRKKRERFYIEHLKCRNKTIVGRTRDEYYKDNRNKINEKKRVKHTCDCGGKYTYVHTARHFKTNKHLKYLLGDNQNPIQESPQL